MRHIGASMPPAALMDGVISSSSKDEASSNIDANNNNCKSLNLATINDWARSEGRRTRRLARHPTIATMLLLLLCCVFLPVELGVAADEVEAHLAEEILSTTTEFSECVFLYYFYA